jgi:hypothetical protein
VRILFSSLSFPSSFFPNIDFLTILNSLSKLLFFRSYIHDAEQDEDEKGLQLLIDATKHVFELPLLEDVKYLKVPKFEVKIFGSPSHKVQKTAEDYGTFTHCPYLSIAFPGLTSQFKLRYFTFVISHYIALYCAALRC